ncbi:hypothetical protein [Nocardia amikacinitolerans]|uniref:hypothetical protein n=1 Tax=Nocardia amikacinitolerans TaxID=756689 RepID=UPI0020A34CD6|nr:hypothetical protein [Nocardia amikacinitolerans]
MTGSADRIAAPRVHLVHPDDIAAYSTGAVNRFSLGEFDDAVSVWLNRATGTLHDHLTR